jgi:hypothetical protein
MPSAYATANAKGDNNQKCGNQHLSWAFVEASNFPRRYDVTVQPVDRAELRQAAMRAIAEFGPLAVRRAAPQVIDGLTQTFDRHNNYAVNGAASHEPGGGDGFVSAMRSG